MAMTRKPDTKAEKAADRKKGIKQSKAEDKAEKNLPPWLRGKKSAAPARGTKGGKAPKRGSAVKFGD